VRNGAARRFKLIVFDWDGTLADSTAIIAESIQAACRDIGETPPDDIAARYVIGLGLADALRLIAPALIAERHSELAARYRHHYLSRDPEIPLFDGAKELLSELATGGYLMAVATGKTRIGLDRALMANGLQRRFAATRCADEGFPKPHPDMLLHLMDRLAVTPAETLMVGDTTHDLELARNAGTSAIAVAYGAHAASGLTKLAPLALLHSVGELSAWLKAFA